MTSFFLLSQGSFVIAAPYRTGICGSSSLLSLRLGYFALPVLAYCTSRLSRPSIVRDTTFAIASTALRFEIGSII